MMHLRWTQEQAVHAPRARPIDDLNELYYRTKFAQTQAEQHGFIGTATALAGIADALALEASIDSSTAWDVAGHSTVVRAGARAQGEPLTQH